MKRKDKLLESILPILSVGLLLSLWEVANRSGLIANYILPTPSAVFSECVTESKLILAHAWPTSKAIIYGFCSAFFFAVIMAVLAFYFQVFRLTIEPLLIISQVIPKVAIAPALLIMFDNGMTFRIVVGMIICFFPLYVNMAHGLLAVNDELIFQARLVGKNHIEVLLIRCVYAIPFVASASKSAILLSTIGVLIAEFLGADKGLGFLIMDSSARYNFNLMFAAIASISMISAVLYITVMLVGDKSMAWSLLNSAIGGQQRHVDF